AAFGRSLRNRLREEREAARCGRGRHKRRRFGGRSCRWRRWYRDRRRGRGLGCDAPALRYRCSTRRHTRRADLERERGSADDHDRRDDRADEQHARPPLLLWIWKKTRHERWRVLPTASAALSLRFFQIVVDQTHGFVTTAAAGV